MPQQKENKKKKSSGNGRKPAHQNTFAFKHNPKSKKTDKILNSPNINVCRRCHDKIEWRKQYRKYKPLTQPSKCNLCSKRNVKAAYHTICTSCTTSDKAKDHMMKMKNNDNQKSSNKKNDNNDQDEPTTKEELSTSNNNDNIGGDTDEINNQQNHCELRLSSSSAETAAPPTTTTSKKSCYRVCAMCVKEPALNGDDDNGQDSIEAMVAAAGRLRLRDRRALERKLIREKEEKKRAEKEARRLQQEAEGAEGEENTAKGVDESNNNNGNDSDVESLVSHDGDDEDDPFLQAIGGADKLLTGEAYQRKLLQQQQQRQTVAQSMA